VQLEHPEQLYQQPVVGELKDNDWSVLMAIFNTEIEAQQLETMLNHQGPIIPASKIQKTQCLSGHRQTFIKTKRKRKLSQNEFRIDFEFDVEPLKLRLISAK